MLLVLAAVLAGQDALAATGMGIKLPEDPLGPYITLGIPRSGGGRNFFTEVVPLPITALLVPVALSLTHVITSKVAFSYFGDPTVILFMPMFIVGEATFITGFADKVGALAVRLSRAMTYRAAAGLHHGRRGPALHRAVQHRHHRGGRAHDLGMSLKGAAVAGKVLAPVASFLLGHRDSWWARRPTALSTPCWSRPGKPPSVSLSSA